MHALDAFLVCFWDVVNVIKHSLIEWLTVVINHFRRVQDFKMCCPFKLLNIGWLFFVRDIALETGYMGD